MNDYASNISLKEKLHQYIDEGDEQLLQEMYEVVERHQQSSENPGFALSELELKELQTRTQNRLAGNSKTYSWQEAKAIIIKAK